MTEKCKDRVERELQSTIENLKTLWELAGEDPEANDEDLGNIYEYGLCFDYVAPGTFTDQNEGYFRYQLSWGGPGDEFRIYADQSGPFQWYAYRIEYWFLDWFDGASITLRGNNLELLKDIFQSLFVDTGTADHQYQQALEAQRRPT